MASSALGLVEGQTEALSLHFPRRDVPGWMGVVMWPGIQDHEEAWGEEGHEHLWGLPVGRGVEPALGLGIWEQCRPRSRLPRRQTDCVSSTAPVFWPSVLCGTFVPVSRRGLCLHGLFCPLSPCQCPPLSAWLRVGYLTGVAEQQALSTHLWVSFNKTARLFMHTPDGSHGDGSSWTSDPRSQESLP